MIYGNITHTLLTSVNISQTKASKMLKLPDFTLRHVFQNESKIILYKLLVKPTVEYCPFLFSNLRQSDIVTVEGTQRDFTRTHWLQVPMPSFRTRTPMGKKGYFQSGFLLQTLQKPYILPMWHSSSPKLTWVRHSRQIIYGQGWKIWIKNSGKLLIKYALIWNSLHSQIRMAGGLCTFVRLLDQALTCTNLARSNTSVFHTDIIRPPNV